LGDDEWWCGLREARIVDGGIDGSNFDNVDGTLNSDDDFVFGEGEEER
jgi:hypothetical protein